MSLGARKTDIVVVKGDKFSLPITLSDSFSSNTYKIVSVDPASRKWTISGNYASLFVSGTVFDVTGNTSLGANRPYTVVSASDSGDNTDIIVSANTSSTITSVNTLSDTFVISSDDFLSFPRGLRFYVSGNTGNSESNKQYDVDFSYVDGSSAYVRTVQDIPQSTDASGSLVIPTIPLDAAPNGKVKPSANKPVDISAYTITSQIRDGDTLQTSFAVTKTDETNGRFEIALTGAQTGAMEVGTQYLWDILIDRGESLNPLRIPSGASGKMKVRDGVTDA